MIPKEVKQELLGYDTDTLVGVAQDMSQDLGWVIGTIIARTCGHTQCIINGVQMLALEMFNSAMKELRGKDDIEEAINQRRLTGQMILESMKGARECLEKAKKAQ